MTKSHSGNSKLAKTLVIAEHGHTNTPDAAVFPQQAEHFPKRDRSKGNKSLIKGMYPGEPFIAMDAFNADIQYYLTHAFKVSRRASVRKVLKDLSEQNSNPTNCAVALSCQQLGGEVTRMPTRESGLKGVTLGGETTDD